MSNDQGRGHPLLWKGPVWSGMAAVLAIRPIAVAVGVGAVFCLAWVAGRLPTFAERRLTWSRFGSATLPEMLVRTALLLGVGAVMIVAYSVALR
jgi:hypothetical protein